MTVSPGNIERSWKSVHIKGSVGYGLYQGANMFITFELLVKCDGVAQA